MFPEAVMYANKGKEEQYDVKRSVLSRQRSTTHFRALLAVSMWRFLGWGASSF